MKVNVYEPKILDHDEFLKRICKLEEAAQRDYDRGTNLDRKQAELAMYKLDVYHTAKSVIGGDTDGDHVRE